MKKNKINKNFAIFSFADVKAGFPSPAEDYAEKRIDLNSFLVKHPAATFFIKVKGDSMINAGINEGDMLVVDRSLDAKNNSIVIAFLDGEFTLKRISKIKGEYFLIPENKKYKPIKIDKNKDFEVWGTVIYVIKNL